MAAVPATQPETTAPREGRGWLWALLIGLGIFALMALVPLSGDAAMLNNWTYIAMIVVLAMSWNFIGGFTGYSAFGNVAFFGIGAYAVTIVMNGGRPFWQGLLVGMVIAGALAVVVGLPVLRLRGHYFAVATLGIAQVVQQLVRVRDLAGPGGESSPPFWLKSQAPYFLYEFIALGVVCLLITVWLTRSRFGYALVAIRENEQAAEALGISTHFYKVAAFTLSALPTAIAGGIYAYFSIEIDPVTDFDAALTVTMVLVAVLGGSGTILGPILGAILFEYAAQSFNLVGGSFLGFHLTSQFLLGLLVVVVTIFLPQGLIRFAQEFYQPGGPAMSPAQRFTEGVRRVRRFIAANGI